MTRSCLAEELTEAELSFFSLSIKFLVSFRGENELYWGFIRSSRVMVSLTAWRRLAATMLGGHDVSCVSHGVVDTTD